MISIKIDGEALDLRSPKITLKLKSPAFNDIPSHSYTFTLPGTDRNRSLLGYPHRPTSSVKKSKWPCQLDLHGWQLGANLILKKATQDSYEVYLALDNGELNTDWADQSLNVINFQKISIYTSMQLHAYQNLSLTGEDIPYRFPVIYSPNLYGESSEKTDNPYYQGFINLYNCNNNRYEDNEQELDLAKNYNCMIPQFYLRWVLKQLAVLNNVKIGGEFMASGLTKEMLLFNNHTTDLKRAKFFCRAARNTTQIVSNISRVAFNDDTSYPNSDPENNWNTTLYEYNATEPGLYKFHVDLAVSGYQKLAVIICFAEELNALLSQPIDISNQVDSDNHIVVSRTMSTSVANKKVVCGVLSYYITEQGGVDVYNPTTFYVVNGYFTGKCVNQSDFNVMQNYILPSDHMPELKVKDLFKNLKNTFGAVAFYNSGKKELNIRLLSTMINESATVNLGELPLDTEIVPSFMETVSFSYQVNDDEAPVMKSIDGFVYLGEFQKLSKLPLTGSANAIAYCLTEGAYYVFTYNNETQEYLWQKYSDYMAMVGPDEADIQFQSSWHPPANILKETMSNGSPTVFSYGYLAHIDCKASTSYSKIGINKSPLIVFQWLGMVRSHYNYPNGTFPCAMGTIMDRNGLVLADMELAYDTPNGLRQKLLQPIIDFWKSAREISWSRRVDGAFMRQLDFSQKARVGNIEVILNEIEVTVNEFGFTDATITAYTNS